MTLPGEDLLQGHRSTGIHIGDSMETERRSCNRLDHVSLERIRGCPARVEVFDNR
jgi:hypothetical protein